VRFENFASSKNKSKIKITFLRDAKFEQTGPFCETPREFAR
jgi:hypothetical protein